ncbi:rubredoxin [Undibacterium sp. SXout20W]|uniref:rubredoxin n=1 Tax=Undibacterium sp. SXout20W TaxID=3413051 RepID=UPI003BF2A6CF
MHDTITYRQYCCVTCGMVYDEEYGLPEDGFPPGTRWEAIPDDWTCPDCSASKGDFILMSDL